MTQITTRRVPRLTPRALLEAPRRSHPISNLSADLAVYTQHTYSFQHRMETREICVVDTNNERAWLVTNSVNASFPQWLGHSDQLIWLEATEQGHTKLIVGSARLCGGTYVAVTIPGPVRDLRVAGFVLSEDDDDLSVMVIGKASPDGTLVNPVDGESTRLDHGKGRPYHDIPKSYGHDDLPNVIWFGSLVRPSGTMVIIGIIVNFLGFYGL